MVQMAHFLLPRLYHDRKKLFSEAELKRTMRENPEENSYNS